MNSIIDIAITALAVTEFLLFGFLVSIVFEYIINEIEVLWVEANEL